MNIEDHPSARQILTFAGARPEIHRLLFDAHGILSDDSAWKRWLFGLLSRMGLHTHYAAFFRVWDREFQPEIWRGSCEFSSALRRFLFASGLNRGQIEEILASTRPKFRAFEAGQRAFPGVRSTLHQLAGKGAQMAVVTRVSGEARRISATLKQMGLSSRLSDVVATPVARHLDDADSYYRWLLAHRHWVAEHVAYVGHDPLDLEGAHRAGMLTIAFNHDADCIADHYIDQFDELVELVGNRRPLQAAG